MTDDRLDPQPAPAPAPPPAPASAPAVAPATGTPPATSGPAVRRPVATIAALALLAVLAVIVWGGGEPSGVEASQPAGVDLPGTPGGGFTGMPGESEASGGSGGSEASGGSGSSGGGATGSPTGPDPTEVTGIPVAALDPTLIAPSSQMAGDHQIASATYEWRLPGRVDVVSQRYLDHFPQPGYRIYGGLGADHPSGNPVHVFTISPIDTSEPPVGVMYFLADPADPQNQTRVGLKIGR